MKVILAQDVKNLGQKGDLVEVAEGYARNYLLPRKMALPATPANLNALRQQKEQEARRQQRLREEAGQLADRLNQVTVTISVKTGEGGRMFGSVTAQTIAEALEAQGVRVDKKKIELKDTIKSLGTYVVPVKLHPEVTARISVVVTEEK